MDPHKKDHNIILEKYGLPGPYYAQFDASEHSEPKLLHYLEKALTSKHSNYYLYTFKSPCSSDHRHESCTSQMLNLVKNNRDDFGDGKSFLDVGFYQWYTSTKIKREARAMFCDRIDDFVEGEKENIINMMSFIHFDKFFIEKKSKMQNPKLAFEGDDTFWEKKDIIRGKQ